MVGSEGSLQDGPGAESAKVPLPPMRLRLHRDSDENFRDMGCRLAAVLYRLGLRDRDSLLDVGCGVGRLPIGLLSATSYAGRYVGFDVSTKHVRVGQTSPDSPRANLQI